MPTPRTPDGRWIVVGGRRWRAADPELPEDVRARLLHHLGTARSAVRTAKGNTDEGALSAAGVPPAAAPRGQARCHDSRAARLRGLRPGGRCLVGHPRVSSSRSTRLMVGRKRKEDR